MNKEIIEKIRKEYGDAFYFLDSKQFRENFKELKRAFSKYYPNFNIAYSYKTNYTPKLCKIVNELGGYAEVVSEMEMELARRVGVEYKNIIWNGPIKNPIILKKFLIDGGVANLDCIEELPLIKELVSEGYKIRLGIRVNFDVNDGVISRFGFGVDSSEFKEIFEYLKNCEQIELVNLQCHFAKRQIEYWSARVKGMIDLIDKLGYIPKYIDIGGGLFGKMVDSLKAQFVSIIPNYEEYAEVIAKQFYDRFGNNGPELIIEPGSALVGDCMKFIGTIKAIKSVRGKLIASILGSQKNITMLGINPPIEIIAMGSEQKDYKDIDLVGFTCIEDDILYKNYNGRLALGDAVIISNCGSYSLVMKPPFILPNFPVLDISEGKIELIKKQETFDDIFHTFIY